MFGELVSKQNLIAAYCELTEKFEDTRKSNRYRGIDGVTLQSLDTMADDIVASIAEELRDRTPITPLCRMVMKKGKKSRAIYTYSVRERIKAQAIYRVIEPVLEAQFSRFLCSYRSSNPHENAVRSVAKRHRKYHEQDTVARLDIENYTDNMDHGIIADVLARAGLPGDVIELVLLFSQAPFATTEGISTPDRGSVTGMPLSALLYNIYLNDLDHEVGKQVALYRRVGDDIIVCDRDRSRVERVCRRIAEVAAERGLNCNEQKTVIAGPGGSFDFIGYRFADGKVSITPSGISRAVTRLKKSFNVGDEKTLSEKRDYILKHRFQGGNSLHLQFTQLLCSYRFTDDAKQIQRLSQRCFDMLVRYCYGSITPRNRRLTKELLGGERIPTLLFYFLRLRRDQHSLTAVVAQAPQPA